ncbi:MAG: enoyl-CoA hydratase-related protein [Rhodospirillales bacterium]
MSDLTLCIEGPLARVVIDRPGRRNAMSLAMWREMPSLFAAAAEAAEVRVIILQGARPDAFSAGADINELVAHAVSAEMAGSFMDTIEAATVAMTSCPKPIVAAISGDCMGGGVELAMACDIRLASTASRFAIPPAKLGALYGFSSTRRLVNLVGPGRAKDLLFSGRLFDATEAYAIGLVDQLHPAEAFDAAVEAYVGVLCQRARSSISGAKTMVAAALGTLPAEDATLRRLRLDNLLGDDLKEGARAFLEKRQPSFR